MQNFSKSTTQKIIKDLAFFLRAEMKACRSHKESKVITQKAKEVLQFIFFLKKSDKTAKEIALQFSNNSIIQNAVSSLDSRDYEPLIFAKLATDVSVRNLRGNDHTAQELDFLDQLSDSKIQQLKIENFVYCEN